MATNSQNKVFSEAISRERREKHKRYIDLGMEDEERRVYIENLYDDWADAYDQVTTLHGSIIAPTVLNKFIGDNKNARILDVAAGTGKAGEVLYQLGFTNVDALDVAEKMLEKAKEKNVYKNVIQAFINGEPTPGILLNSYDALICAHAFSLNQLQSEALDEFTRIIRPGGWLCFTAMKNFVIRKECGFLQKICDLVLARKIDMILSEEIQYVSRPELTDNGIKLGQIFVCKVL